MGESPHTAAEHTSRKDRDRNGAEIIPKTQHDFDEELIRQIRDRTFERKAGADRSAGARKGKGG